MHRVRSKPQLHRVRRPRRRRVPEALLLLPLGAVTRAATASRRRRRCLLSRVTRLHVRCDHLWRPTAAPRTYTLAGKCPPLPPPAPPISSGAVMLLAAAGPGVFNGALVGAHQLLDAAADGASLKSALSSLTAAAFEASHSRTASALPARRLPHHLTTSIPHQLASSPRPLSPLLLPQSLASPPPPPGVRPRLRPARGVRHAALRHPPGGGRGPSAPCLAHRHCAEA